MNIEQIKTVLGKADIWFAALSENHSVDIDDVTTIPHVCDDMHKKIFVLNTGNIREAEQSVFDWDNFANVILDADCIRGYLKKITANNLMIVGRTDIGKAIGAIHEALNKEKVH